jgi:hypothetical protein
MMKRLNGCESWARSATLPKSSSLSFDELRTEIRLHVYSYLYEIDLSRLTRVSRKILVEVNDSLHANTQFTLEVASKSVRLFNLATIQGYQTSEHMRPVYRARDLPAHFTWVRQLRLICDLDVSIADEQQNLVAEVVTKLLASNLSLKTLLVSFKYTTLSESQKIPSTARHVLEPLQLFNTLVTRVKMIDVRCVPE